MDRAVVPGIGTETENHVTPLTALVKAPQLSTETTEMNESNAPAPNVVQTFLSARICAGRQECLPHTATLHHCG